MMIAHLRVLRAFTLRELRAAIGNRFVQIFTATALLAGLAPLVSETASGELASVYLLQVVLYLVPLFAQLIGTGSAQADLEERPFLCAQPGGRLALVLGKFLALWVLLSLAALALVLPAMISEAAVQPLLWLWVHAIGTAGVFLGLGLACGFSTADRVKAHLTSLCVWLAFLAGFDLLALFGAYVPWLQSRPSLWTSLLMLNPLDSLRIGALLSVDRVPFETAQVPPLARWWLTNLKLCFVVLNTAWIALALGWSRQRMEKAAI